MQLETGSDITSIFGNRINELSRPKKLFPVVTDTFYVVAISDVPHTIPWTKPSGLWLVVQRP